MYNHLEGCGRALGGRPKIVRQGARGKRGQGGKGTAGGGRVGSVRLNQDLGMITAADLVLASPRLTSSNRSPLVTVLSLAS